MQTFDKKSDNITVHHSGIKMYKCNKYFEEKCLTGLAKEGDLSCDLSSSTWNANEVVFIVDKARENICNGDNPRLEREKVSKAFNALEKDYNTAISVLTKQQEKQKRKIKSDDVLEI